MCSGSRGITQSSSLSTEGVRQVCTGERGDQPPLSALSLGQRGVTRGCGGRDLGPHWWCLRMHKQLPGSSERGGLCTGKAKGPEWEASLHIIPMASFLTVASA